MVIGEGFCKYFSIIHHVNQRFKDALAQHQSACAAGRPLSCLRGGGWTPLLKVCPYFPSLLLGSQLRPISPTHVSGQPTPSVVWSWGQGWGGRSKLKPATHQLHITLAFHYRHSTAHPHQFAWRWGGGRRVGRQANICNRGNRERKRWAIIEAAATVPNYNRCSSSSSKNALSTV